MVQCKVCGCELSERYGSDYLQVDPVLVASEASDEHYHFCDDCFAARLVEAEALLRATEAGDRADDDEYVAEFFRSTPVDAWTQENFDEYLSAYEV